MDLLQTRVVSGEPSEYLASGASHAVVRRRAARVALARLGELQKEQLAQLAGCETSRLARRLTTRLWIALGRPTSLAVSVASAAACYYLTSSIQVCVVCVLLHAAFIYLMVVIGIVYYLYGPPLADMTDVAASYFQDPGHHFWVAEVDGNVAGTIAIVRKQGSTNGRKIAWLRRMAVDRRYRRLGIAKKLIAATIDFSRSHGYECIQLITTEIHAAARTLYRSLGFVQVAYKPYLYLHGLIKVWTYEFEYRL